MFIVALVSWIIKISSGHQIIVILSLLIGYYVYRYYNKNVWKKWGVPYLTPVPFFGNELDTAFGLKTVQDSMISKYRRLGRVKYGGLYSMNSPVLLIKDLDLIETILIKDFSHFTDRGIPFNEKRDPLSAHLFNLTGKRWKGLRNKLSPVFTSGKLKTMHDQLVDCADELIKVLETDARSNSPIDFKETMSQFTTDVIGSCAYGINTNSLQDPDNEFRNMGRKLFVMSPLRKIRGTMRQILRSIHPQLNFFLGVFTFPKEVTEFFMGLVQTTIAARENNPEFRRNDFIQLLMNLRQQEAFQEGKSLNEDETFVHLDDNLMAANSFLFFVAGFETTASTLAYCLFELANHTDIQEKLYQEVQEVLAKHENQPTYDAIKQLHYMDMVISETLRKYPPVPLLMRVCTENYRIPDSDVVLPKGTRVEIPVYALHHDPEIYPDPEDFRPLRFSPENKDSIPKGAYLPFGDGPRICIGARFAQMEIKVCLSKILSKFHVLRTPGLPRTIEFNPKSQFILVPKTEILLQLSAR